MARHGSSGATGASEPRRRDTPASSRERNGNASSQRPGHSSSIARQSSTRCHGWTLRGSPSLRILEISVRSTSWACSMVPVAPDASYASSTWLRLASPIACVATVSPWARARDCMSTSSSSVYAKWPLTAPSASRRAAVRLDNDPSAMIFSDPIRSRPSPPGSGSPVRSPAAITSSSVLGKTPMSTRGSVTPSAARRCQGPRWSSMTRSTRPTTPRANSSRIRRSRASARSCGSSETRGMSANQSPSRQIPSNDTPYIRCAVVFSQPLCASPAMRMTGCAPLTASSSAVDGSRDQDDMRWPNPTTSASGGPSSEAM